MLVASSAPACLLRHKDLHMLRMNRALLPMELSGAPTRSLERSRVLGMFLDVLVLGSTKDPTAPKTASRGTREKGCKPSGIGIECSYKNPMSLVIKDVNLSNISLYGVGGWIVAGIGVSLFLLGFFARRVVVRSEPQCAKCGYPLDDIPRTEGVVICPECGREPKNPTETYTLRRRKGPMAIGAVLFVGALVLQTVPTMQRQGWAAALPMSVQIRMWATGDKRLRERVAEAFRNDTIHGAHRSRLRAVLLDAMGDPTTTKPIIDDAVEYLDYTFTKSQILDEQDLVQIIADETSRVGWLYMRYTSHYPAPLTGELAAIRRSLALDTTNEPAQRNAIEWLIRAPVGALDLETIGQILMAEDSDIVWKMVIQFDHASKPVMDVVIEYLDHPDATVRARAMRCIQNYYRRVNTKPISVDWAPIFAIFNDADQSLRENSFLIIEDLPLAVEPLLDELLRSTTNPEALSLIIGEVIRRNPDPINLTPALAVISRDERHPLRIRLEAADAYGHVRRRARAEDEPEDIWSVYDAMILALRGGDFDAAFAFGQKNQPWVNSWAVGAIGRLLLGEGIERDQLGEWFAGHPALEALLGMLSPGIDEPVEAYRRLLIDTRDDEWYTPDRVRDSINRALETYFPDALDASQP